MGETCTGRRDVRPVSTVHNSEAWYEVFQRILIVCVGNICRSPTAELLFRHRLPHLQVASAGLHALAGKGMDDTARSLVEAHGLDGSQHVARQIDDTMIRDADLILAMETSHVDTIVRRCPHARGRTLLLNKWVDRRDIPDPYRQQRPAFEHVYRMVDAAVQGWAPYLQVAK